MQDYLIIYRPKYNVKIDSEVTYSKVCTYSKMLTGKAVFNVESKKINEDRVGESYQYVIINMIKI